MNPDFTLIWPLSCLKDGDHLFCDSCGGASGQVLSLTYPEVLRTS